MGAAANYYINVYGYSKFKGYINAYENDVINSMGYASNTTNVSNCVYKIASYVGYVTTATGAVLAGPEGWAAGLTWLSRATMLAKFGGWTSTAYGTYARLDYSIDAAKQQYNEQKMMTTTYWPNVTWSFPVIY